MRGLSRILALIMMVMIGGFLSINIAMSVEFPFAIYQEQGPGNHYVPSGRMGDTSDLSLTYASKKEPHSGANCIRIMYNAELSRGAGWAGIYWQNPANNWGNQKGGYDLSGAKKLTFWAKGAKGGEIVEFKIGGIIGSQGDTAQASTGPIQLSSDWKQYSLDVSQMDLSRIIGGFCLVISNADNPDGATFYLDDIVYE